MRTLPLLLAALGVAVLAGCGAAPEHLDGAAQPAGGWSESPSTPAKTSAAAAATAPSSAAPTKSAAGAASVIRATDWANVTLENVVFLDLGDLKFRGGEASSGANNCTMLPAGARAVYAEFLTEE